MSTARGVLAGLDRCSIRYDGSPREDAARAIDFHARAFGAVETPGRITDSTGRIGHTEITDPFGYRWTLSTHGKDASPEQRGAAAHEPQRRATAQTR
jgi:uncharacterized glyoxalase superfamily protein PhnB